MKNKTEYIGLAMSRLFRTELDDKVADLGCNRSRFVRTAITLLLMESDSTIVYYMRKLQDFSLDKPQ